MSKSYGGVPALKDVSFVVSAGEICGYLGPNGAGKSTTMKVLCGLLPIDAGEVRIGGFDVRADPVRARSKLGYVPESGALYSLLSAREHLALVADLHELDPATATRKTAELFEVFDLAELADRRIDTLSKGQKQKVVLATAFLSEPDVLLLDEPLNGLDVKAARALKELMLALAARGGCVLYSSHILDVVERVCERAIILHQACVVADAPTFNVSRSMVHRS